VSRTAASRRKKKKSRGRILPAILVSLAAGSLITIALVYSPAWFKVESIPVVVESVFHFNDSAAAPDTIRIQVRNGAGVSDLARWAQNFLETRDGDVTFYAPGPPLNAEEMDYAVTVVISHDTSFAAARAVADVIGVGDSSIVMLLPPPGHAAPVDVTVILGRDRNDPSDFIPYRD
jgi:hypothetical protein